MAAERLMCGFRQLDIAGVRYIARSSGRSHLLGELHARAGNDVVGHYVQPNVPQLLADMEARSAVSLGPSSI